MRVLIVEDDPVTSTILRHAFEREGVGIEECDSAEEALEFAKLYDFDTLIVDMHLHDADGHALVRKLRQRKIETPIIAISSETDTDFKLQVLFAGADDFIDKPFDVREVVARQKALIRRIHGYSASEIRVGRMTLDLNARSVKIDDQRLSVTAKEYSILELLALRRGTTLTKETFLDHLYGGMDEPEQKIIDVFVCKLRKKIAKVAAGDSLIETVWGHGYILNETPQQLAEEAEPFLSDDTKYDREDEVAKLLLTLIG